VVGGNPYGTPYAQAILNQSDQRIRCVDAVWDAAVLNGLYANCYCYLHGHEVGGTNPSLLRAMHAGAPCVVVDVEFTREVVGEEGLLFVKAPGELAALLSKIEDTPSELARRGAALQARASAEYRWDAIAAAFTTLFRTLLDDRRAGGKHDPLNVYHPHDFPTTAP
jgi:glycosyltransferase involved in cell wall biosynthesis